MSVLGTIWKNRHFFSVQRACYGTSDFARIKKIGKSKRRGSVHMKKRLISLLLSVAVLTTSVLVSTFADPSAGQEPAVSSEESQERGIGP